MELCCWTIKSRRSFLRNNTPMCHSPDPCKQEPGEEGTSTSPKVKSLSAQCISKQYVNVSLTRPLQAGTRGGGHIDMPETRSQTKDPIAYRQQQPHCPNNNDPFRRNRSPFRSRQSPPPTSMQHLDLKNASRPLQGRRALSVANRYVVKTTF